MVERQKGSAVTERHNQRPKRRRLNPESQQSPKPNSTPTRTSPRLARKTPAAQKKDSAINWETELPNATAALDSAISKIASHGAVETRDFCDEIADFLTQALFEDIWDCEKEDLLQESSSFSIERSASKSDGTAQQYGENIEPNVKGPDTPKQIAQPPKPAPAAEIIILDPITSVASASRDKPEKRKREKSIQLSKSQTNDQDRKGESRDNKKGTAHPRASRKAPNQKERHSDGDLGAPRFMSLEEGLVEEVVEIEEDFVDGSFAFDRNKILQGDVEEQVLDRSGSTSIPNSKVKKNAALSGRISKKKHRSKMLHGDVEEQVLDRSGDKSASNSEVKNLALREGMSRRLPWWCVADNDLDEISKSEKEVLRSYVAAIIRTCIRESWNAETLRESFRRDPSSNRGQAFRAVHESLQLLERARHVKECESRWHPELLRELLERQEMDWSIVKQDKKFDHFVGCDACLGHRQATARIWLKGQRYDASDFWPGTSRFRVISSEQVSDRRLLVSAELRKGSTNDHLIRIGANENDTEFWVDSHCLRKCLLFHELVHSTATIARDFRRIIEKELGNGTVELKLSSRESNGGGTSVSERLERFLLRSVLHDKEYVHNHVDHLIDIIRLGDVYFSSPDAEVLDSGKPGKSIYVPNIYDAPLDLGDEEYRQRIDEVVARSRRKRQSKHAS